jgi:hypothetical protein
MGLSGLGRLGAGLLIAAAACDAGSSGPDWCSAGPALDRIRASEPVLPGTTIVLAGSGFDPACGDVLLVFRGTLDGRPVEARVAPSLESVTRAAYAAGPDLFAGLGADRGAFVGEAGIRVAAAGRVREAWLPFRFRLETGLSPRVDVVSPSRLTLNAPVLVRGDGLLEGAEGTTEAVLSGTFRPDGGTAPEVPVAGVRIPVGPVEAGDRTRGEFPWSTAIAGIRPGAFSGTLVLENAHRGGETRASPPLDVAIEVGRSMVTGIEPPRSSLGAVVAVRGAGFVGGRPDEVTTLRLDGTAFPHGGVEVPVDGLEIVTTFRDGAIAEYVPIPAVRDGRLVAADFGFARGRFVGSVVPVLRDGSDRVEGIASPFDLELGPVRQVVWVSFLPGFSDALRRFGLHAVEGDVRGAVLAKLRRVYPGVNVEFREARPDDYYAGGYAILEIGGPDPNGRGLFGYDNTPGKDVGNLRLHDRIGGANAETQEDGYAGYGGVFVESLLCWSAHPPADVACPDALGEPDFDRVFDPVRAREAAAGEYPDGPDPARAAAIAEAVRVLGNVVGDTAAHEFGHSLGLANPYGAADRVHRDPPSDACLMDAGAHRPFAERAERGSPGAGFCGDEIPYLREILPVD